jgi:hypothetical protein
MNIIPQIYILIIAVSFCATELKAQIVDSINNKENPAVKISESLKMGIAVYDVMNGIKPNSRLIKLSKKIDAASKTNREWFVEHTMNTPEGEPLAYHKNLGVTEEEYKEFLELSENIQAAPTARAELLIKYAKAENRVDIVLPRTPLYPGESNSKLLIIKDTVAYYNGIQLKYTGLIIVDNEKNGFRSKWTGYTFSYEDPPGLTSNDLKDLTKLNYHSCKVIAGKLEKGNKSIIHLKETLIKNGEKTISTDYPLVYSDNQRISFR